MFDIIDKLAVQHTLSHEEFRELIENRTPAVDEYLFAKAREIREKYYGKEVYLRGLIEISNYCRNNCFYCGIRNGNREASRYRMSKADILSCCREGYALGFRTFVLQGGEDAYFTDEKMIDIVSTIRQQFPDCAITLSLGEKSYETYKAFYDAGADRYLLRHETATPEHYAQIHPAKMLFETRQKALQDLMEIGYQVGSGFMVGTPFQTASHLATDLLFLANFRPHMIGIGPFLSHHNTPFSHYPDGSVELTLFLLGLLRLILPASLLPSTTALGVADPDGREKGLLAGANVIMPNLSPEEVRAKYILYDNKIGTHDDAASSLQKIAERVIRTGYHIAVHRGDAKPEK